jgi:hypothetical protein
LRTFELFHRRPQRRDLLVPQCNLALQLAGLGLVFALGLLLQLEYESANVLGASTSTLGRHKFRTSSAIDDAGP